MVGIANVAGHRFSSRTFAWHCRHGWPWEYLARWRATPLFSGVNERISLWPAAEDVNEFRPWALAGNVAVGLVVVVLAVVATRLLRRAWPRIRPRYRSTWVVFGFGLLICGLANYPGRRVFLHPIVCQHGWPWAWLHRDAVSPEDHYTVSIWTPHRNVLECSVPWLATDAAACLLLAGLVAALSERRRRGLRSVWQFTLKDALAATALAAMPFAWPAVRDFWHRDEIRAVQQLRAAGYAIAVDPRRPDWFWESLGADSKQAMNVDDLHPRVFSHPDRLPFTPAEAALLEHLNPALIGLSEVRLGDIDLSFLRQMTGLRSADFSNSDITDDGLAALRAASGLRWLQAEGCPIDDSGLTYVASMTDLWELDLSDTSVTDAGLIHLRGLPELQRLELWGTKVTDAGMMHIAALPNLESVYVSQTAVADDGVAILVTLPKLCRLELAETRVTDEGLKHLDRAKYLLSVNLAGTGITDVGLAHLARLEQLEMAFLLDCPGCTPAGVARLQQARPKLGVLWTPGE